MHLYVCADVGVYVCMCIDQLLLKVHAHSQAYAGCSPQKKRSHMLGTVSMYLAYPLEYLPTSC